MFMKSENPKSAYFMFFAWFFAVLTIQCSTDSADSSAHVKIIYPRSQQIVPLGHLTVLIKTENFKQIQPTAKINTSIVGEGPLKGHVHLWLDVPIDDKETAVIDTTDTVGVELFTPGRHKIIVQLMSEYHSSLNIVDSIMFEAKAP